MNALEAALARAKELGKAAAEKAKRAAQEKDINASWERTLRQWVQKHVDLILSHDKRFVWNGHELLFGASIVCKISVKWTYYDHGYGEREEMDHSWRVHVGTNHSSTEEHFVKYLAEAVAPYLVKK
jgi:hypothetical protein